LENSVWKRLWICHKTDYYLNLNKLFTDVRNNISSVKMKLKLYCTREETLINI
jgi:hypothetical protein